MFNFRNNLCEVGVRHLDKYVAHNTLTSRLYTAGRILEGITGTEAVFIGFGAPTATVSPIVFPTYMP